jgi:excisionase family DNA binding protein
MEDRVDYTDIPPVMTVPEMAKILRIGRNTAYDLCITGELKNKKIGRIRRILREDLLEWLTREDAS